MKTHDQQRGQQGGYRLPHVLVGFVMLVVSLIHPASAVPVKQGTVKRAKSSTPSKITVFAASSLAPVFTQIVAEFEKQNPLVRVTLSSGGSATLLTQLRNGAPADVFAAADTSTMDAAAKSKVIRGRPIVFARNTLSIVVAKGNPREVKELKHLARKDLVVALGAPGVPIGDYSRAILVKSKVVVKPKTLEASVSGILTKVALGEVDAGIVYVTDIASGDPAKLQGVSIPPKQNTIATYPVAVTRISKNKNSAQLFLDFLASSVARKLLTRAEFLPA
jgi:molybdate transport system substrate-binding protein